MLFKSLRDDVVVIKQEEEQEGIIALVKKNKILQGVIVEAGPGKRLDNGRIRPMVVKVGDRVAFGEWSGQKATIDGAEYLVMVEQDIIGVLEDE